jgi:hypothetical protein
MNYFSQQNKPKPKVDS